ncbi:hypothetical protein QJQ45_023713 [Haematococcus lacustris]|nr:hypothetical protein QJQ45_023713 [Haematococcus lacustris]
MTCPDNTYPRGPGVAVVVQMVSRNTFLGGELFFSGLPLDFNKQHMENAPPDLMVFIKRGSLPLDPSTWIPASRQAGRQAGNIHE